MCASLLDLALGVRTVRTGRTNNSCNQSDSRTDRSSIASGLGRDSLGDGHGLGLGRESEAGGGGGEDENNEVATSLLEVLRQRADDERPLVRAKALQAFGTALSLRWPR